MLAFIGFTILFAFGLFSLPCSYVSYSIAYAAPKNGYSIAGGFFLVVGLGIVVLDFYLLPFSITYTG